MDAPTPAVVDTGPARHAGAAGARPGDVLSAATRQLLRGHDLAADEAQAAIAALLDERAATADVAVFLTAMTAKRPSAVEVAATARVVIAAARPVAWDGPAVDVVGSGGDGSDSVNISTVAALITAAAGATVAKAGNRAATSRCGSADVLEALGVPLGPVEQVPDRLARHRFAFLFSPAVHPVLGRLAPVRRRLGFRTLLNLAGPLSNPVRLGARLIGAADRREQMVLAEAASLLGMPRTWVVHGHGGMDELTTGGANAVVAVDGPAVTESVLDPAGLGLRSAGPAELRGGDREENAAAVRRVLSGAAAPALTDTCLLNAAAALHLAGAAPDIAGGLGLARAAVADGRAAALLAALAARTAQPYEPKETKEAKECSRAPR